MFGIMVVPAGIVYPSYSSSWMSLCGTARGEAGFHLYSSRMMHSRYGKFARSSKLGKRPGSKTRSISAWAWCRISGCSVIARMKEDISELVESAPAKFSRRWEQGLTRHMEEEHTRVHSSTCMFDDFFCLTIASSPSIRIEKISTVTGWSSPIRLLARFVQIRTIKQIRCNAHIYSLALPMEVPRRLWSIFSTL